jgi:hypothetical protein
VLLTDGRALITGGDVDGLGVAGSAELYVPNGWSPSPSSGEVDRERGFEPASGFETGRDAFQRQLHVALFDRSHANLVLSG